MATQVVEPRTTLRAITVDGVARGRAPWGLFISALAAVDSLAVLAAFAIAYFARFKAGFPLLETPPYSGAFYSNLAFWSVPIWVVLFAVFGLYDRRRLFNGFQEYTRIANACVIGMLVEVLFSFLDVHLQISRGWLLLTCVLSILLVCSGRFLMRRLLRILRGAGQFRTPTLIVGANEEGRALAEQLMGDPAGGPQLLGFIESGLPIGSPVLGGLAVLGSLQHLSEMIPQLGAEEVIVASTAVSRDELLDLYRVVGQDPHVELRLSSGLFEILTTGMHVEEVNRVPLMTPERVRITGIDALLKTAVDYALAVSALVVLSPVLLLLGLLVRLDSPGPVIHRRRVLGVSGKPFDAFKFRTMIVAGERRQRIRPIPFADRRLKFKSAQDPRVTRMGRFLRKTSLDELPQLVNVLRGEMSLVGPRMIAPDERFRYGKWQHNLLTVKPGITGPWQVAGRGDIPYEERVQLSMHYIRNYTFWSDLEIMMQTISVVLKGRGAY